MSQAKNNLSPPRNIKEVRALGVMGEAAHPLALVVDDEELLRLFAAGLLEEHGFEVMEAENAAAALKVLESHQRRAAAFHRHSDARGVERYGSRARGPCKMAQCASRDYVRTEKPPSAPRFRMMAALSVKPYGAAELFTEVDDLMRKS